MEITRFTFHANGQEVIKITDGKGSLYIPADMPADALRAVTRLLSDRIDRPIAWRRRQARAELRDRIRRLRGGEYVERPIRRRRFPVRGLFRMRGLRFWRIA